MENRYVNTVIGTYSVLAWINALTFFIAALALTFLSPFAVTFLLEHQPTSLPSDLSMLAFQQLATGIAVMMGVIVFMLAAFFLALGVGLWRRRAWARSLVIIPCVMWLFAFPIGSLVGIFGLYMFIFDKDVRKEFGVPVAAKKR